MRVATTVLLTAAAALAVLLALAAVVAATAFAAPGAASSDAVYWTSAAAATLVQFPIGVLAARRTAPRLRRAGVSGTVALPALTALGPCIPALLANLRPIEHVAPPISVLAPLCAAVLGTLIGLRRAPRKSEALY
ncbi:hypothetical protein HUT06_09170 [Actinomadura sp. NAK00032]|uniref:hypothetical protein n=1 Tax=Actinomadura sp. NAK00032 TaxID=2742128 RepID=UPI001591773D|nr:hypothetical protein [Actinomadura sp. NAK00032]QKW34172.1 hypothetical protein HUT06_09170 [Actinomadura sp. NAK00032]